MRLMNLQKRYRKQLRKFIVKSTLELVDAFSEEHLINFGTISQANRLLANAKTRNPFYRNDHIQVQDGDILALTKGLFQESSYAASSSTLILLAQLVTAYKPRCILEFGSGISTICLANLLDTLHGADLEDACVYSVDHSDEYVEHTRQLLRQTQLEHRVRLLYAPIQPQTVLGNESKCYDLRGDVLRNFLGNCSPDFIVVDGPSGGDSLVWELSLPSSRFWITRQSSRWTTRCVSTSYRLAKSGRRFQKSISMGSI